MGLTQLEICNHALLKVGADTIDTLTSPTSTEDGTKRSIDLCNIFFDQAYEEVLRIYPWNSAKMRSELRLDSIDTFVPSLITVYGTGTAEDTDYLYVGDTNGKGVWESTSSSSIFWDGTKWKLFGQSEFWTNDSTSQLPPVGEWSIGDASSPAPKLDYKRLFGYERYSLLPSDLLRLIDIFRYEDQRDERTAWVVEGGYILSDYDTLYLKYIAKPADTTTLDPLCTNAVICMLAMKLCVALQLDDDWSARIENELYGRILPQARSIDTFENKELLLEESSWLLSRDLDYPVI